MRLHHGRCVGGWLGADSRFAFKRQVHQTYRTNKMQGNIFDDGMTWAHDPLS